MVSFVLAQNGHGKLFIETFLGSILHWIEAYKVHTREIWCFAVKLGGQSKSSLQIRAI